MKSFNSGVSCEGWSDGAHRLVFASMTLNLAISKAVKEKELGQNLGKELRQFRQEITVAGV
jgi:hypothetical protein